MQISDSISISSVVSIDVHGLETKFISTGDLVQTGDPVGSDRLAQKTKPESDTVDPLVLPEQTRVKTPIIRVVWMYGWSSTGVPTCRRRRVMVEGNRSLKNHGFFFREDQNYWSCKKTVIFPMSL